MKNECYFHISEDISFEGDFIYVNFSVDNVDYLFTAFLEKIDNNGNKEYQITFDSIKNIEGRNAYERMPPRRVCHFLTRIFECILAKIVDKVKKCYFMAMPAEERLARCYKKLAYKYNKKSESLFVIRKLKVSFEENGDEYDCYSIRQKKI